jgi:hypothetical protein
VSVVAFQFTSPQFIFDSGMVSVFRVTYGVDAAISTIAGQRMGLNELARAGHSPQTFTLRNGFVEGVTVDVPGQFEAVL